MTLSGEPNDGTARPGRNPLLEAEGLSSIRTWVTNREALVKALVHRPFAGLNLESASVADRLLAIPDLRRTFVPAPDSILVPERMLLLIYHELERRNPLSPHNQRWVNSTAQWLGSTVDVIPWQPVQAQAMVVEGMTGIGKSHGVERTLSLLPQVVEHCPNGDWGMQYLKQLVYLRVAMPADHSRLGFLEAILLGMDDALGTRYAEKHVGKNSRIERLIVFVMHLLVQHRCGLLIIEEAQDENLAAYARVFLNFFLRLLNWGIPVLLVGNPRAFELIKTHAQDVDRFCEGGWITMLPPLAPTAPEWDLIWIPGLWRPSVISYEQQPFVPLDEYPGITDWSSLLWQLTGGLPRQLCRLRMEVLEAAVRRGRSSVDSRFVYETFRTSPRFIQVRARNAALANHDLCALACYTDLPVNQLRLHWGASPPPAKRRAAKATSGSEVTATPPLASTEKATRKKLCRDLQEATKSQRAKRPRRGK